MNALARIALLLVIVLIALSAYLRLTHSGIGCTDWPACYGRIGEAVTASPINTDPGAVYARMVEQGNARLSWATPLHRLVASVLGLIVVLLNIAAFRRRQHRLATLVLLGLVLFLATLGIWSGGLHSPAVVMGNLCGGFGTLAVLGWIVFHPDAGAAAAPAESRRAGLTVLAIVLLGAQIALGGLTSANFAAAACPTLPDCNGAWLPGAALGTALDLSRQHAVDAIGVASGGPERVAVHLAHRWGALLALAAVFAAALAGLRVGGAPRALAAALVILASAEVAVGVAAVLTRLPIGLAVAHNFIAGMLLLGLLLQLASVRRR